jgi:H+/Cl- antiporter ClcA
MNIRSGALAIVQWAVLGAVIGVVTGSASALFLVLLDAATHFRESNAAVVFALPLAGVLIGLFYARFGTPIRAGNDLVIDTIHDEGPQIPLRMAPMVLVGTVLTHLFGGSAGREGTAVQMGASLADAVSHVLRVPKRLRTELLSAGVAGGFGSVFGTPIAGTIFGLEFVVLGQIQYRGLVPALVASVVGDMTTRAWGVTHTAYPTVAFVPLSPRILLDWLVIAVAVGLTSLAFTELVHALKVQSTRLLRTLPIRMLVGGAVVVLLFLAVGTGDYLGLGIPTILRAFEDPTLPAYAFALKLLFTAVTLGAGFLGGEVTPLFFIGATLGSVLARALGIPIELGAAVGLAAAFGSASNAPIALSIMAVELFGAAVLPHVAIVCVLAYLVSGHRGIYGAQRVLSSKQGAPLERPFSLHDLRGQARQRSKPDDVKG